MTAAKYPPPSIKATILDRYAEVWARDIPWLGRPGGPLSGSTKPATTRFAFLVGAVVAPILNSLNPAWSAEVIHHRGEDNPRAIAFRWGDEEARVPVRMDPRWLYMKGYQRVFMPGVRATEHVAEIVADAAEQALGPVEDRRRV